jgi:hypothetical protein
VSLSGELVTTSLSPIINQQYTEFALAHKADGERVFLIFLRVNGRKCSYLLYRDATPVEISTSMDPAVYDGTCFDAEVVEVNGGWTVMIFDTLAVSNRSVTDLFYPIRVEVARRLLSQEVLREADGLRSRVYPPEVGEYASTYRNYAIGEFAGCGTGKKYWITVKKIYRMDSLVHRETAGQQLTNTDGFVFTNCFSPYMLFRQNESTLFKWKPYRHITIDFQLISLGSTQTFAPLPASLTKYQTAGGCTGLCIEQTLVATLDLDPTRTAVTPGQIVECAWRANRWSVVRTRLDKSTSNSWITFTRTLENLEENLSFSQLLSRLN